MLILKKKLPTTTVVVTHDIREAYKRGDVVVILDEGRIIQMGAPEEIKANPSSAFVERFIDRDNE